MFLAFDFLILTSCLSFKFFSDFQRRFRPEPHTYGKIEKTKTRSSSR